MTELQRVILIGLGLLILLSVIVGAALRHYIGGFIATVEREAEEEYEREERERLNREATDGGSPEEDQTGSTGA